MRLSEIFDKTADAYTDTEGRHWDIIYKETKQLVGSPPNTPQLVFIGKHLSPLGRANILLFQVKLNGEVIIVDSHGRCGSAKIRNLMMNYDECLRPRRAGN